MPELLSLPLGALDDDPGIRPQMNVYVASKAQWFTIYAERKLVRSDGAPQAAPKLVSNYRRLLPIPCLSACSTLGSSR
jgi:hypothetical protein